MSNGANEIAIFVTLTQPAGTSIELNPVHIESQVRETGVNEMPLTHIYMISGKDWFVTQTPEEISNLTIAKAMEMAKSMMSMVGDLMNGLDGFPG
jgi:uncharacterized protein YlzI (FlbEa/FlbD family)